MKSSVNLGQTNPLKPFTIVNPMPFSPRDSNKMNSTAYFEAWKYPKGSLGDIKPGRRVNKTQAELQSMIGEFKQPGNSLRNDIKVLLSAKNKDAKQKWDCEAAELVEKQGGWDRHILIIFRREMTPKELKIEQQERKIEELEEEAKEQEGKIERQEKKIEELEEEAEEQEGKIERREKKIEELEEEAEEQERRIEELEEEVEEQEGKIEQRKRKIEELEEETEEQEKKIEQQKEKIEQQERKIEQQEGEIEQQERKIGEQEEKIEDLEGNIEEQEEEIEDNLEDIPIPRFQRGGNHRGREEAIHSHRPRYGRNPSPTVRSRSWSRLSVSSDSGYQSRSENGYETRREEENVYASRADNQHRRGERHTPESKIKSGREHRDAHASRPKTGSGYRGYGPRSRSDASSESEEWDRRRCAKSRRSPSPTVDSRSSRDGSY